MILVIVESPSKAKKIQDYLGKDYIVKASKGHIADLAKGGSHGLGVDIDNGFKPKYILMEDKVATLNELMQDAKKCDQIFVASDPDREGEAIAWHLSERLKDIGKPIKRMVFNEIKKDKLLKAVQEVRDIDMNLFHAQEARRILDRVVGFMTSPFLMNFYGPKLSAGRVQSVVTRMIIDREEEINNFVPETFFNIHVTLSNGVNSFTTKYSERLTDQQKAEIIRDQLNKSATYVVSEVLSAEEKVSPSPPLVTSTLQRIMSKLHGVGADKTMQAAQALYEMGFCTYIRTDSVRVSDDALIDVRNWLKDNKYSLPKKPNVFKNKNDSQDAHECIRPSDLSTLPDTPSIIDPDQKLVYETIWKYFVASQMLPAVYSTLKVTAHVQGHPELQVKTSGKALKSLGYLEILGNSDNSQIDIPNLNKGDLLQLFGNTPVKLEKKQTQPQPRFSEDKLLKELESKNIGRPATYADLLSKVTTRNYVEKKGNVYHPTDLGKKITNVLIKHFNFMDYNYTSKMENLLDEIETGKVNRTEMLSKFYPEFKSQLDKAYLHHGGQLCDKCGAPMVERNSKNGKFLACSKYPKCINKKNIQSN